MHEQHILHRDIKPENIFLSGKQKLKLGDLGLAIRSTEELPFTRSGTLDYMAPEVSCLSQLVELRLQNGISLADVQQQHLTHLEELLTEVHKSV